MTNNTKILLGVGVAGVLAFVIYKLTKKPKETTTGEVPAPKQPNTTEPKSSNNLPKSDEEDMGLSVYKIVTKGGNLNRREKPSLSSPAYMDSLPNGSLVRARPSSVSGWFEAYHYNPKGSSKDPMAVNWGFVSSKYLKYVSK